MKKSSVNFLRRDRTQTDEQEMSMEIKTFAALADGQTFRFPGQRRFFVKTAGGFKNIEGGALHECPADAQVLS